MSTRNQARLNWPGSVLFGALLVALPFAVFAQQPQRKTVTNEVESLMKAAQAAQQQGRLDQALQIYNRVIASTPNNPAAAATASLSMGNIYMAQKKFENAAQAFQRSTSLNPANAEVHNNLGEALGELKQFVRAIEAFNRAVAIDPKLLKARYNMAVTYDRLGNHRYSEFVFRNLIKNSPDYSLGFDGLAVTLSKSGRAKESIPFHQRAIALNPNDPSFYFNLAISYLILGDTGKALELQEKLKAIDPGLANHLASVIVKRKM